MSDVRIGVIGGSGLYAMDGLQVDEERRIATPFGEPSDAYVLGELDGRQVAFLARHGRGHRLLPTELNFRANIYGFKMLGVEFLISVSAVGSMKIEYVPSRHRGARPVLRPHPPPARHLLRQRPGGARLARQADLGRASPACSTTRRERRARRCTRAAPTSTWRGRSSRPGPSRRSTASGAWTSSA